MGKKRIDKVYTKIPKIQVTAADCCLFIFYSCIYYVDIHKSGFV